MAESCCAFPRGLNGGFSALAAGACAVKLRSDFRGRSEPPSRLFEQGARRRVRKSKATHVRNSRVSIVAGFQLSNTLHLPSLGLLWLFNEKLVSVLHLNVSHFTCKGDKGKVTSSQDLQLLSPRVCSMIVGPRQLTPEGAWEFNEHQPRAGAFLYAEQLAALLIHTQVISVDLIDWLQCQPSLTPSL